jgi:hypothetical protein
VADDDEPALVPLEEFAQPHHAVGVEVVGGLVEDHRLGVGEEDAGQLDATALAAREGLQRLIEDAVRKREVVRDGGGFRLRCIAAQRFEALGEVGVLAHGAGRGIRVVVAHGKRRLVHAERDGAEAAGVEDAGAREHLGIARPRVLRQVSELAGAVHLSRRRQHVAGEHLRERRLARSVASDEADLVARGDAERHVRHEHAGAHADLEVVHGEHRKRPFLRWM